jgi:hypothetical protein
MAKVTPARAKQFLRSAAHSANVGVLRQLMIRDGYKRKQQN